jgi:hypothetical protein
LGFDLVIIDENDREYIDYGKEIDVNLNHKNTVATLKFILDKQERGHVLRIRRFDIHDCDMKYMKKNVSEDYLRYAEEELKSSFGGI